MTMLEDSYMRVVPNALREIAKSLEKPAHRFVKMTDTQGRVHHFDSNKVIEVVSGNEGKVFVSFEGGVDHYFEFDGSEDEALAILWYK